MSRRSTVALIGVSNDPKKLTARPLEFCKQHKFSGKIYLVNPHRKQVQGQTAFPSVSAIPEKIDHAYIMLSTELVEAALDDCIAAGVSVVTILADGFAEAGEAGRERQARLVAKAELCRYDDDWAQLNGCGEYGKWVYLHDQCSIQS